MKREYPIEVRAKTGAVLAAITMPDEQHRFEYALNELVSAYDSQEFKRYMESFGKLMFMAEGIKPKNHDPEHGNAIVRIYSDVSQNMNFLKGVNTISKRIVLTDKIKSNLLVSLSKVRTGLEIMALQEEELNEAFRHQ